MSLSDKLSERYIKACSAGCSVMITGLECKEIRDLESQLAAEQAESKRLREALEEYGAHPKTCDMSWGNVPNKCSCGLEQALKG